MVAWSGVQHHDGLTAQQADLHTDLADLEAKENQLDDLIKNAELHLKLLNEDKSSAYVTYQDLRSIHRFTNQTVMVIKAPPEAKLQVPHPSEVRFEFSRFCKIFVVNKSNELLRFPELYYFEFWC